MRQIITEYYQSSNEPTFIKNAINEATVAEASSTLTGTSKVNTLSRQLNYAMYGAKK